ncbi:hypothetical protein P9112_005929 [Eukaryota sp. TZLM1-RC]
MIAALLYLVSTPLVLALVVSLITDALNIAAPFTLLGLIFILPSLIAFFYLINTCIRRWKQTFNLFLPVPCYLVTSLLFSASVILATWSLMNHNDLQLCILLFSTELFFSPFVSLIILRRSLSFGRILAGLLSVSSIALFLTTDLDPVSGVSFHSISVPLIPTLMALVSTLLFTITASLTRRFALSFGRDSHTYTSTTQYTSQPSSLFTFTNQSEFKAALVDVAFASQIKDLQFFACCPSIYNTVLGQFFGLFFLTSPICFLVSFVLNEPLLDFNHVQNLIIFNQELINSILFIIVLVLPLIVPFTTFNFSVKSSDLAFSVVKSLQIFGLVIFSSFLLKISLSFTLHMTLLIVFSAYILSGHYSESRRISKTHVSQLALAAEQKDVNSSVLQTLHQIKSKTSKEIFTNSLFSLSLNPSNWDNRPATITSGVYYIRDSFRGKVLKQLETTHDAKLSNLEEGLNSARAAVNAEEVVPDEPSQDFDELNKEVLPGQIEPNALSPINKDTPPHRRPAGLPPLRSNVDEEEEVGEPMFFYDESGVRD